VIHLTEAQALHMLGLAGEVHVPQAVEAELSRNLVDWPARRPDWVRVDALVSPHIEDALAWQQASLLHIGEAEAIALVSQIGAEWLLTDDNAARLLARSLGIEAHGSLGIVLWAAAAGHVNRADAEATLERLAQSSLWVSAQVLTEARAALVQIFQAP
jgi:predicted nucleic acid-binding protein